MTPASPQPQDARTPSGQPPRWGPLGVTGCLLFVMMVIALWRRSLQSHELIYLLGPRRLSDPDFLATDLTWSHLPPTTFLFDHLLALLRPYLSDFAIVNIGSFLTWALTAWSLTLLARILRLPWWSLLAGYVTWLLYGQTLAYCGSPFEGFQPKSLAYPLIYFALGLAMRGQVLWAGLALGLATAWHIIVGGWACLALFVTLLLHRRRFPLRQLCTFLLATAPFILPVAVAVGRFHLDAPAGVETARMDEIYALFAMPHCCDPTHFMSPIRWDQASTVFALTPLLLLCWPERRAASILNGFVTVLIALFVVGVVARHFEMFWLLKLYPFQLAKAIPLLFFFVFALASLGTPQPRRRLATTVGVLALIASIWMIDLKDATKPLVEWPERFVMEVQDFAARGVGTRGNQRLYRWIREHTPRQSVFITPLLGEFWWYAERAQVVGFSHPPLNHRIIEWEARLIALNRSQPFTQRGFRIREEFGQQVNALTIEELVSIRERYGATHYLTTQRRQDLENYLLFVAQPYHVYDVVSLGDTRSDAPPARTLARRLGTPAASTPPQPGDPSNSEPSGGQP